ncbi:response regulator transcription factor [Aliidiomarina quisquiliarum]|uniref:LuxR C-terminal-related transcriptional regulator n=1 Tax=Aliidiomarina quisquiliarum TaxID=2938947 RepID=UPI00208E77AE|nr:response regulator transcription factor [Aliidiomarina quisquiliarum]MCO4320778.1 response regulator transcription factor [Aliidiomarina quisquiliarum]
MKKVIVAIPKGVQRRGVIAELTTHHWQASEVNNNNELLAALNETPKAVVIISIHFDRRRMQGLLRSIYRQHTRAKVILWTNSLACALDYKTRHPLIPGYFYRFVETDELIRGCNVVALGQRFSSPYLTASFKRFRQYSEESCITIGLSNRERQIFQLVSLGVSVKEIAERLVISNKTVNTFRYRLYEKLQVDSDVQLAHLAIKSGLVEPQGEVI